MEHDPLCPKYFGEIVSFNEASGIAAARVNLTVMHILNLYVIYILKTVVFG